MAPIALVVHVRRMHHKKLDTADDATKKVKFGDTARASAVAKKVGTNELKIPLNQNKTGTKTGGMNVA